MQPKILCVDDEQVNLKLLEAILVPQGYTVILADSGKEALEIITEQRIDVILLDVIMPDMNGFEVCKIIKEDEKYRDIPIIVITALTSQEDRIKSIMVGAENFIIKPFDRREVLARIKMLLRAKETENAFAYTVHALARAAEANDEDTGDHILRVGVYCVLIAQKLKLSSKFIEEIRLQAPLHDVGKIHTHPDILRKSGKLTPAEWQEVKKHTLFGAKIVGEHTKLKMGSTIALTHHERWDGSGYPYGLKGEKIPLAGRIVNIADQYDALRNSRAYKPAFDHETTVRIITEGDGRTMPFHFDPQVLQAFKESISEFEETYVVGSWTR